MVLVMKKKANSTHDSNYGSNSVIKTIAANLMLMFRMKCMVMVMMTKKKKQFHSNDNNKNTGNDVESNEYQMIIIQPICKMQQDIQLQWVTNVVHSRYCQSFVLETPVGVNVFLHGQWL